MLIEKGHKWEKIENLSAVGRQISAKCKEERSSS